MKTVNQLILDCVAKVLRINQTTDAQISIEIEGYIDALECDGYKHGYYHGIKKETDAGTVYQSDYDPFKNLPCGWLRLDDVDVEKRLRALLESLNDLEKELMTK